MPLGASGPAGMVLNILGVNELLVLFSAGFLAAASQGRGHSTDKVTPSLQPILGSASGVPLAAAGTAGVAAAAPFGLLPMFLFFVKGGSVLFGSGYVLLASLRADLVERWHWLTEGQLLDAIAVGQVTPGPVFTEQPLSVTCSAGRRGAWWPRSASSSPPLLVAIGGRIP